VVEARRIIREDEREGERKEDLEHDIGLFFNQERRSVQEKANESCVSSLL
jgi:hypothetical protein